MRLMLGSHLVQHLHSVAQYCCLVLGTDCRIWGPVVAVITEEMKVSEIPDEILYNVVVCVCEPKTL